MKTKLSGLAGTDLRGTSIEVEARFGEFTGDSFTSGIDRNIFIRVRDFITKLDPRYQYIHSKDEIYQDNERFTTVYNEEGMPVKSFHITKTRIQNYDIPEYFFRVSISREIIDNEPKPARPAIYTRRKKRWSVGMDQSRFRLDLTEVTIYAPEDQNPRRARTVYEIELEVLQPKIENLDRLDHNTQIILKEILDSPKIYPRSERDDVIRRINSALGSRRNQPGIIDHTILSQARNIKARDLVFGGIVPSTERNISYSVTIKADGIRKLLVIDPLGIYLAMAPHSLMKIFDSETSERLQSWHGTIIEGELIPKENLNPENQKYAIYFLMFDVLSVSGDPGIRQRNYPDRLSLIDNLESRLKQIVGVYFAKKEFLPFGKGREFYTYVGNLLYENWPFKTDGLVFTPWNHGYITGAERSRIPLEQRKLSRYPDILKWKPVSKLTIDFKIRHTISAEGEFIDLLSIDKGQDVPFRGTEDYPFNPQTMIMPSSQLSGSPTETIAEFRFHPDEEKLQFVKIRPDKIKPNLLEFAKDNWTDIHRPVDEDTIRGRKFSLVFRYHNRVKWSLFNYVKQALPASDTRTLLSVGSGRGGDVKKWEAAGFTHVVCVEPNQENRDELKRRLDRSNLQYLIVPTVGQDVEEIVKQVRGFAPLRAVEVVSYMLSLSFFFDSPESSASIVELINQTLMHGGYFIALTIDGRYVQEFFTKSGYYHEQDGVKRAIFKMMDFELRPENQIYINIPRSIVTEQIEYLTNISSLQEKLKEIEVQPLLEERVNKEHFMTNEELYFTQFFTQFIMKRDSVIGQTKF